MPPVPRCSSQVKMGTHEVNVLKNMRVLQEERDPALAGRQQGKEEG